MTESPMIVGSIAPWYGAKRSMAQTIVAELGPHQAYWEPFCGSMAVLLAKPPSTMETVNDLHRDIVNLARVIQDRKRGPQLYRRLRREICSQVQFERYQSELDADTTLDPLDRALFYFYVSWCGMNGMSGTRRYNLNFARRFTIGGGQGGKRFSSAVESIPAIRRRLRRATVISMDAFDLINRVTDEKGSVIYCDPPYLAKGSKYVHDFTAADHVRLAEALQRFKKTRVVVSYYDHPKLAKLYPGWTIVQHNRPRLLAKKTECKAKDSKAPEVLILNGPSLAGVTNHVFSRENQ